MKVCDCLTSVLYHKLSFLIQNIFGQVMSMTEVLSEPQFQIFTHPKTGIKTGRIYFPALFLAEYHESIAQWLQRQEVIFCEA